MIHTKLVFARFLAILVLVVPGLMAMKGFLMMKDALFLYYADHGNDQVSPRLTGFPLAAGCSCSEQA